jgi:opacity protein-like surface antigen
MLLLVAPLFFLFPSTALAEWVGSANIGVAIPSLAQGGVELEGDSGYSFGASLGVRLNDLVQWDTAEISYASADQSDFVLGTITTSSLALGTGVRIGLFGSDSKFHPYGSFGIGGARLSFEEAGVSVAGWGFEWNIGAGLLYDYSETMALGARYRYRSSSFDELSGVSIPEFDVNIHTITFEIAFGG